MDAIALIADLQRRVAALERGRLDRQALARSLPAPRSIPSDSQALLNLHYRYRTEEDRDIAAIREWLSANKKTRRGATRRVQITHGR